MAVTLLIKQICQKNPKSSVSNLKKSVLKSDVKEQKIGSCFGRNSWFMKDQIGGKPSMYSGPAINFYFGPNLMESQ